MAGILDVPQAAGVLNAPVYGVTGPVQPQFSQPVNKYFERNKAYVLPGEHQYNTQLTPDQEQQFRAYIADRSDKQDLGRNFDPSQQNPDYDMRGWWLGMINGDPHAEMQVDPNDGLKHRNDYYKTPYHETFSSESQWAAPNAPTWNDKDQLVAPDGTIIFDDRANRN